MLKWLTSLFKVPQPAGPPETVRAFRIADPTIARSDIQVREDAWLLEVKSPQTFRLFEVEDPGTEQCLITYRVMIRSQDLAGRAFLEMWCRFPGKGEFFSKGLNQTVRGTTGWASYEIPFYLKKGQKPDLIKLNLAVEGTGQLWLRDVQLLKTPLSS